MDTLQLLEQKISSLVSIVKELKTKKDQLQEKYTLIQKDHDTLKTENARLAEESAQLVAKIGTLERESLKGNDQINELNQEKTVTKMAVDDLLERLKVIDSIIEQ